MYYYYEVQSHSYTPASFTSRSYLVYSRFHSSLHFIHSHHSPDSHVTSRHGGASAASSLTHTVCRTRSAAADTQAAPRDHLLVHFALLVALAWITSCFRAST